MICIAETGIQQDKGSLQFVVTLFGGLSFKAYLDGIAEILTGEGGFSDSCPGRDLPHGTHCKAAANPSSVPHPLWLGDDSGLTYLPGL